MKRTIAVAILTALTACTPNNMAGMLDSGSGEGADDSGPDDSGADDTATPAEPVWFDLAGSLTIEAGAATALTLTVAALPEASSEGPICAVDFEGLEPLVVEELPDPLVWHWWQLELPVEATDCPGVDLAPRSLRLGLGELYPAVVQGVEEHGLGEAKDSLYGTYASFEAPVGDGLDGTTYAYGYAGTEADRAGETTAVLEGPLPDGVYQLSGYYLFKLPI